MNENPVQTKTDGNLKENTFKYAGLVHGLIYDRFDNPRRGLNTKFIDNDIQEILKDCKSMGLSEDMDIIHEATRIVDETLAKMMEKSQNINVHHEKFLMGRMLFTQEISSTLKGKH